MSNSLTSLLVHRNDDWTVFQILNFVRDVKASKICEVRKDAEMIRSFYTGGTFARLTATHLHFQWVKGESRIGQLLSWCYLSLKSDKCNCKRKKKKERRKLYKWPIWSTFNQTGRTVQIPISAPQQLISPITAMFSTTTLSDSPQRIPETRRNFSA